MPEHEPIPQGPAHDHGMTDECTPACPAHPDHDGGRKKGGRR